MIKIGNNLIINTDSGTDIVLDENHNYTILTCGLRLNSTITASSISDEGFTFCLQRAIISLNHRRIPQQEFNVKWSHKPDDIFIPLAFVTALMLCDVDTEVFKLLRF